MNKWTILLLFLVIVGGGIYLIPKIETTETVQYKEISKQKDCGHYDVTLLNGAIYHGYVEQINKEEKTVVIESFRSSLLNAFIWVILILYVRLQIMVWGVSRYFFDTDFFNAWWEYAHRPASEEFKQAFKSFFGYP